MKGGVRLVAAVEIYAGLPCDAAKRIVMAALMLHGACVGEEAGARNLRFSV